MTIEPTKTPQTGLGQWDAVAERKDVALWEKSNPIQREFDSPRAQGKIFVNSTIDTCARISKNLAGEAIDIVADSSERAATYSYSILSLLKWFIN